MRFLDAFPSIAARIVGLDILIDLIQAVITCVHGVVPTRPDRERSIEEVFPPQPRRLNPVSTPSLLSVLMIHGPLRTRPPTQEVRGWLGFPGSHGPARWGQF
jgi:hypothetical protein